MHWREDPFYVSTDSALLNTDVIHDLLRQTYWSPGIPRSVVERAMSNSLCFGLYTEETQIGFARVVSDRATFAYLADVFVLPEFRGRGLSKFMMRCIKSYPELQNLRRWTLATSDAHNLYRQFGFTELRKPENYMEILDPDVYQRMSD